MIQQRSWLSARCTYLVREPFDAAAALVAREHLIASTRKPNGLASCAIANASDAMSPGPFALRPATMRRGSVMRRAARSCDDGSGEQLRLRPGIAGRLAGCAFRYQYRG